MPYRGGLAGDGFKAAGARILFEFFQQAGRAAIAKMEFDFGLRQARLQLRGHQAVLRVFGGDGVQAACGVGGGLHAAASFWLALTGAAARSSS